MMPRVEQLFASVPKRWPPGLEERFFRLEGGPPPAWYLEQYKNGLAALFALHKPGGRTVAYVLCRREADPDDLVVIASATAAPGERLSEAALATIEGLARLEGCQAVRFHTIRPGLVEVASRHGYALTEMVMRRELEA